MEKEEKGKRSEASKGRWGILRRGVLDAIDASGGRERDVQANETYSSASVHRHEGFRMFEREEREWVPAIRVLVSTRTTVANVIEQAGATFARYSCHRLDVVCTALEGAIEKCVSTCQTICRSSAGNAAIISVATKWISVEGKQKAAIEIHMAVQDRRAPGHGGSAVPEGTFRLVTYRLRPGVDVAVREPAQGRRRLTLAELFSHRLHGVDNTGNVRVWAAEQVLLHTLLGSGREWAGKKVLEMGAGMTGLAGLGIAACTEAAEVVVTDGNPDAVACLQVCAELNRTSGRFGATKVYASKLKWDAADADGERAALLEKRGLFDAIILADCLFFADFHYDLIAVLSALLADGGRVSLCQPRRGGSMACFVSKVEAAGFSASETADFNVEVSRLNREYSVSADYDPDIHRPVWLELRRKEGGVGADAGAGCKGRASCGGAADATAVFATAAAAAASTALATGAAEATEVAATAVGGNIGDESGMSAGGSAVAGARLGTDGTSAAHGIVLLKGTAGQKSLS